MDPITLAITGIGLGMQIFGGMGQADAAKEAAAISKDEAKQEMGINQVKQQQMELEAKRSQIENVRNAQRARAMATNSAVNQGAQFGSGLAGGLAQVTDQSTFNMLGVNQALSAGRQIAGFNDLISQDKMKMADTQAKSADAAGMASLGGALMKSAGTIGNIGQGFGSTISNWAMPRSNVGI